MTSLMTKIWPTVPLAATVLLACTTSRGQSDALQVLPTYSYSQCSEPESVTSALDLSQSAGEAEVYRLEGVQVDEAYAADVAHRLGIDASPAHEDNSRAGSYAVDDGKARLFIDVASGIMSYRGDTPLKAQIGSEPVSDADAVKTAEQFLRDSGLHPHSNLQSTVAHTTTGIDVTFEPADIPIQGLPTAERVVVTLSTVGTVWGLSYEWREPQPMGEYPIVSEADALDRLRSCQVIFGAPSPGMQVAHIELVYLGVPIDGPLDYLIPVYKLEGASQDATQRELAVVPAIADKYLESHPPATP